MVEKKKPSGRSPRRPLPQLPAHGPVLLQITGLLFNACKQSPSIVPSVKRHAALSYAAIVNEFCVSQAPLLWRRQTLGVTPTALLNVFVRWDWSANPVASAISHSGSLVASISSCALASRVRSSG